MAIDQRSRRAPISRHQARQLPPPTCDEWSWQSKGRCRDHPAELFFPEEESRRRRRLLEEQAKRICHDCPVLAQCRSHALTTPETYGVWGAMTATERARW